MKQVFIAGAVFCSFAVKAGNEDRVGSAGASELLVNPWARSSALGDANIGGATGLEATFINIAGLAATDKTQIKFNYTNWMGQADVAFNSAGIAQRVSSSSVVSVSVQSMNYGDVMVTTVGNPEGTGAYFSPRINIFNVGFAKSFTQTISGGINFKVVSESISNMKGTGIALDAGIRYVTGEQEQIKFGITLKNVGPTMKYKGDGLTKQVVYNSETGFVASLDERSANIELPSLLSVGLSYDFIFNEKNKLTTAFAYTANSYSYDQYRLGLDYAMKNDKMAFNLRGGYVFEKNIFSAVNRSNALIGPTVGFSVDGYVGKKRSALGIEYAARFAGVFGVIHTIGATINLK